MRIAGPLTVLGITLASASSGFAQNYKQRLETDRANVRAWLIKKCPKRKGEIARLATPLSKADRSRLLADLEPCGDDLELYHLVTGTAHLAANAFKAAERSARKALAMRVTESAQISLLSALTRQKNRTARQKAELAENLEYFRSRQCTRDDLCAGLAYVAWHVDDYPLAKRASVRAIELGFTGWQPYFFGGTAYGVGKGADRKKAVKWLREAKRRGGPSAVDEYLRILGAEP